MDTTLIPVDCACVIHGDAYDWTYVEKLHAMLTRHLSSPVRMHVWTEATRSVPHPYIKHNLVEWPGVHGPRRAWWYKLQMFNSKEFSGRLLYFDLDVVIIANIDWILQGSPRYFWCLQDFKYLWRPTWQGMNSSVMYWDTTKFHYAWKTLERQDLGEVMRKYAGDQDYLSAVINQNDRKFFDRELIQSWRWQVKDGGLDMQTRNYRRPNAGSILPPNTSILIFHGKPKPHEIQDPLITTYWRT